MWLNCPNVAEHLGKRHNERSGIAPLKWLQQFAEALNRGARGNRPQNQPLPLYCNMSPGDSAMQTYAVSSLNIQQMKMGTVPTFYHANCQSRLRL